MCDCPDEKKDSVVLFDGCSRIHTPGRDVAGDGNMGMVRDATPLKTKERCPTPSDSSDSTMLGAQVIPRYQSKGELLECECYEYVECMGEETSSKEEEQEQVLQVEKELDVECTLAIVKPEAVVYENEIVKRIREEGFEIYATRHVRLTPEQASQFYEDSYGRLDFPRLVAYMSSGPIIAYLLGKQNAVKDWKRIVGPSKVANARLYYPDSLRARYGRLGDDFQNAVHASACRVHADKELRYFFPDIILEPFTLGGAMIDYSQEILNKVLVEALTRCCKLKPADPVLWLAHWLIQNNPNKPRLPEELLGVRTLQLNE